MNANEEAASLVSPHGESAVEAVCEQQFAPPPPSPQANSNTTLLFAFVLAAVVVVVLALITWRWMMTTTTTESGGKTMAARRARNVRWRDPEAEIVSDDSLPAVVNVQLLDPQQDVAAQLNPDATEPREPYVPDDLASVLDEFGGSLRSADEIEDVLRARQDDNLERLFWNVQRRVDAATAPPRV